MSKNVPVIEMAKFAEEDSNHMRGTSVGHFPALGGGWEVCMICCICCRLQLKMFVVFSYYLAVIFVLFGSDDDDGMETTATQTRAEQCYDRRSRTRWRDAGVRDCRIGCWLKRKIFVLFWYYLAVTTMIETTATTDTRPARNSDTTGGGGDQGHDGGMPALLMAGAVSSRHYGPARW